MKPLMLFTIILMTAIILASSFGLHIMPIESIYKLSEDVATNALYVCPIASQTWDPIAAGLRPYLFNINLIFFFGIVLLLFGWGWGLYQNLLNDSFKADKFKNPWFFTKFLFWVTLIITILIWTPNHYRTVHIQGATGDWVMCESNSPGAIPVRASAVKQ